MRPCNGAPIFFVCISFRRKEKMSDKLFINLLMSYVKHLHLVFTGVFDVFKFEIY